MQTDVSIPHNIYANSLNLNIIVIVLCCKLVLWMLIIIQSTLVISNFTGPDKNVRVISSSRQPNCDIIGMKTVRQRGWKAHVYGNLNNLRVLQFALLLFVLGDTMVLLE